MDVMGDNMRVSNERIKSLFWFHTHAELGGLGVTHLLVGENFFLSFIAIAPFPFFLLSLNVWPNCWCHR